MSVTFCYVCGKPIEPMGIPACRECIDSGSVDPIAGTWDFFHDAADQMIKSDQPFLLVTGQAGHRYSRCAHSFDHSDQIAWIRTQVTGYLDEVEARMRKKERGEGD